MGSQTTTNHWDRAPPLDGGEDEDADDTRTDTTVLDDSDDIASSSCQQTATIDVPNLLPLQSRLLAGGWPCGLNARCSTSKNCLRSTALGPSQLLARSKSSTQSARSETPHALTDRVVLPNRSCELTPQIIDLAQGWSDAVGTRSSHADLVAMVASVDICVKLHSTRGQIEPHTLPDLLVNKLGMNWQSWRLRIGWKSVVCVALCKEGTGHGMQSQTQGVTWPTAWQQRMQIPVRSAFSQKLVGKSAWFVTAVLLPPQRGLWALTCGVCLVVQADPATFVGRFIVTSV